MKSNLELILFAAIFSRFEDEGVALRILDELLPKFVSRFGGVPAFLVRACLLQSNLRCLEKILKNQVDWDRDVFPKELIEAFPPLAADDPKLRLAKFVDVSKVLEGQEKERPPLIDLML